MDEYYHSCDCWCHCSARRETGNESLAIENNNERKGENKIALLVAHFYRLNRIFPVEEERNMIAKMFFLRRNSLDNVGERFLRYNFLM